MARIAILIEYRIRPGRRREFEMHLRTEARRTLQDDGCLRMDVFVPHAPGDTLWLHELWRDRAALDAHRAAPGHTHAWQEPLLEGKRVTVCSAD